MQRVFLIFLVLTIFSCIPDSKKSGENNLSEQDEVTGITKIEFNENIHDFGHLKSGEIVVYTFTFENIGEHNLLIENLKSDCGCLQIRFSKESIKPGETGNIEVEFNSSGLFGKQFKSIEIYANTKELKHLAIFAEIENEHLEIKY
jgi:hypothetical protein